MAVKTADRTFLKGQSVDLFRAAIKSQTTRDPYERRLIGFLASCRKYHLYWYLRADDSKKDR